eukprot:GHRQ01015689.1.p3 GENE.GHRQ01015689.1~~GHRQ01015689.1.p3  ORF type:complete len:163 (+),score=33.24 GHRQ01015689.1:547-1035(+)
MLLQRSPFVQGLGNTKELASVRGLHGANVRGVGAVRPHAHDRLRRCRIAEVSVHSPVAEKPPGSATDKEPGAATESSKSTEQFSWTKAWYPVAAVENLDADKPNKCTLLGRDYVLWADAGGAWRCFEDRCPHRLATLSDGVLDKQRGEIVCAYHGWRFQVGS